MADEFTPHLNLTKPEVGASDKTCGDKLNANADAIDAAVVMRWTRPRAMSASTPSKWTMLRSVRNILTLRPWHIQTSSR